MESETNTISDNTSLHLILPEAQFAELASGRGSTEVIRTLWGGQRSRRLILLRALSDAVRNEPSLLEPLPSMDHAWQALVKAEKANPERLASLILHPQIGNWLAYTLRIWRGGAQSTAPRHIDFGQMHSLALAATALAGLSLTTQVPLRDGRVMVPMFGMAYFSDCKPWDIAEAGVDDGRIWFRHGHRLVEVPSTPEIDGDGWWGLRSVAVGKKPLLRVWVDDLDPMRDLADPIPPARLSEADFQRWSGLLSDAWATLSSDQPDFAEALSVGVTSLVPLPIGDGWDTRSASSGDAFGAILCSPPPDAATLAVSLVHEFMHIKLGGLMHLLPITEGESAPTLYAPWRDDPRPLGGLIQGIYAFIGIAAFWRHRFMNTSGLDQKLACFEYYYARMQAQEGLESARTARGLTDVGASFFDRLAHEMARWATDRVSDDIEFLTRLVFNGHRTGWRLRHCRPSSADVEALAAAWSLQKSSPILVEPSDVVPDPNMLHWSQGRLGLARRQILSPESGADALREGWASELTDADIVLFSGEAATACKCFSEQIADDPENANAWVGLGLALIGDRSHTGWRALRERPEVVQAVYRRVSTATVGQRPSPLEVTKFVDAVAVLQPQS